MNRRSFTGILAALSLVVTALAIGARAQQRSAQFFIEPLSDAKGQVGLGLALRKLTTVGTFMHTTAHPDDENNAVLALHARGLGMRVALVTATRGDGGQNEIGPELFDAHRRPADRGAAGGAPLGRRRAVLHARGRLRVLVQPGGDDPEVGARRDPRRLRPHDPHDPARRDGHAAADRHRRRAASHGLVHAQLRGVHRGGRSAKFPEQLQAGAASVAGEEAVSAGRRRLRPARRTPGRTGRAVADAVGAADGPPAPAEPAGPAAQPPAGGDLPSASSADPNAKYATIDTSGYDALLGCTIGEVGGVAASMHKCQGRSPIQNFGGASRRALQARARP